MMKITSEFVTACRKDRDGLFAHFHHRYGVDLNVLPPATYLDELLADLGMRVVPRVLPRHKLGEWWIDRGEITINSRLSRFTYPNTDVNGLQNSTKAHELGHIRLGHAGELLAEMEAVMTPMFEAVGSAPFLECVAGGTDKKHRREMEADFYAATFLVPEQQLMRHPEARLIERCRRDGADIESHELWRLVHVLSNAFAVTPSLMAHRLDDIGWIVRRPSAGEHRTHLAVHPEAWLPSIVSD